MRIAGAAGSRRGASASAVLLLLLASCAGPASAYKVKIAKGKNECISAVLQGPESFEWENSEGMKERGRDDMAAEVDCAFEIKGGNEKISARVTAPSGRTVWERQQGSMERDHKFSVPSKGAGAYNLCFNNTMNGEVEINVIYFTLKHMIDSPDFVTAPAGTAEQRSAEVATEKHAIGVSEHVREIDELLKKLANEQKHMRRRMQRHMETQESTSKRVWTLSFIECFVLVGVSAFQLVAVQRLFRGTHSQIPGRVGV